MLHAFAFSLVQPQFEAGGGPTDVPSNTSAPTFSGTLAEGQTLTGDDGLWSQPPILSYARKWQRADDGSGTGAADIDGATGQTYVAASADKDKYIRFASRASNAIGAAADFAYSEWQGPIGYVPAFTVTPAISASTNGDVGIVYTCDGGTVTGTPTPTKTYQWKLNGSNIGGATASTYTPGADQAAVQSNALTCTVTATNSNGSTPSTSNSITLFHPLDLSPAMMLDAERADLLILSGSTVTSWTSSAADAKTYSQGTASFKPVYSATGLNGRPSVAGDGVDDYLEALSSTSLPTGSTGGEIWAGIDQTHNASDASQRAIYAYGASANNSFNARRLIRVVTGGVNRAQSSNGNNSAIISAENGSVDFSGRHIARATVTSTSSNIYVDAVAGTPAAVVPSTQQARARVFATTLTTPSSFFAGPTNFICVFSGALSAAQATSMDRWGNARAGL